MDLITEALWFFLPAGVANVVPMLVNYVPILNRWETPLDFGKRFKGKRIFGDNKRWRGVFWGALAAGLIGLIQYEVIVPNGYSVLFIFTATAAMGLGALIGDALESLIKRLRGMKPGDGWFPFDQIDYIIGGLIFVSPFADLSLRFMATVLVLYFGLHIAVTYIGYALGLKKSPI